MENFNGLDKSIETTLRLLSLSIKQGESGNGASADIHGEDLEFAAGYIKDEMNRFKGYRNDARMGILLRLESCIYSVIDAPEAKKKSQALENLKQEMKRSETEANALKELNGNKSEPILAKPCRGFTGPVEALQAIQEQRRIEQRRKLPNS